MISKSFFSDRLKSLRQSKNISQAQLANVLGVTYAAVSMMESDKRKPSYEVLITLADMFDVSLDYLCGRSESRERLP
jgi:transcriptional regulator with XRE-family HTH domain